MDILELEETEEVKVDKKTKPMFSIKVYGNNCIVDINNNNGKGNTIKTVKLESLVKAFQNTDTKIESPILPLNCIRYQEHGSNISVILYHPPKKFNATCFKDVFEDCIRPGIVIKYILGYKNDPNYGRSYNIQDSRCFGVVDDFGLFSNKTQLFGLPFPNISSEGWVCWGSNSIGGEIRALTGLYVYIDRIFNSPFNSHIFHNALLKNYGINEPRDLFKYIQGRDRFPNELLENLGAKNWTLGKL
jgi:hypothetical protein